MPTKRPRDVNSLAKQIVDEGTGEAKLTPKPASKDPEAVKRGKARADKLTPAQRSEIARKAARTRWQSDDS